MKKNMIILILSLISSGVFSQGVYNNGGKIVIGTGAFLVVNGSGGHFRNETNVTSGAVELNGTLRVDGNYTNNSTLADILVAPSTGTVLLKGSFPQTLGGASTVPFSFSNLSIDNSAGISLANNASITGVLTLTSGLLALGTNNLLIGPSAVISGSPSATAMVVPDGTGELRKSMTGTGSFTFPVGDNTGTADYSPVTLDFTSGTFGTGAYAGVSLVNAAFNDPLVNTSYLNRYWNVSQSGISGFTCNAAFDYLTSDVTGTEADITTTRISPAPATFYDPANTLLHQLTAGNLSSFGTFTGALGFRTLNLKLYFEGLYVNGGTMNPAKDVTGPKFGPAIADEINVDLHDAVTFPTVHYTASNIPVSTSGNATVMVPANYSGQYYMSVHHRNSVETVSGSTVTLSGTSLNYDFSTSASQAFGNNMKQMGDGNYALYGGDANGDEAIDGADLIAVENDVTVFAGGYILTDVNGDGVVDASDLILVENNAFNFISIITP